MQSAAPAVTDRRAAPLRLLLGVNGLHCAGDMVVAVALAHTLFFSVPMDGARSGVALYLALSMAPVALLTPVVEALLVRRADGCVRGTLVVTAAVRAVVALALIAALGSMALYPLALLLLLASRAHGISRTALVPDVAPDGRPLVWANTWMSTSSAAGSTLGAGLGAGLVALGGPTTALVAASTLFVLAAVGAAPGRGRARSLAPRALAEIAVPVGMRLFARGGGAALPARTVAAGLAMAVLRFATGFLTFLLAFATRDTPVLLSAVLVAAAVGGALGIFGASALRSVVPQWLLPPLLLVVLGVVAGMAASDVRSGWAAVLAATAGLTWACAKVAFDGQMQGLDCSRARRAVVARYTVGFQICWLLGAAASMPPFLDPNYALAGLAVGALMGAAGAMLQVRVGDRAVGAAWTPKPVEADIARPAPDAAAG